MRHGDPVFAWTTERHAQGEHCHQHDRALHGPSRWEPDDIEATDSNEAPWRDARPASGLVSPRRARVGCRAGPRIICSNLGYRIVTRRPRRFALELRCPVGLP